MPEIIKNDKDGIPVKLDVPDHFNEAQTNALFALEYPGRFETKPAVLAPAPQLTQFSFKNEAAKDFFTKMQTPGFGPEQAGFPKGMGPAVGATLTTMPLPPHMKLMQKVGMSALGGTTGSAVEQLMRGDIFSRKPTDVGKELIEQGAREGLFDFAFGAAGKGLAMAKPTIKEGGEKIVETAKRLKTVLPATNVIDHKILTAINRFSEFPLFARFSANEHKQIQQKIVADAIKDEANAIMKNTNREILPKAQADLKNDLASHFRELQTGITSAKSNLFEFAKRHGDENDVIIDVGDLVKDIKKILPDISPATKRRVAKDWVSDHKGESQISFSDLIEIRGNISARGAPVKRIGNVRTKLADLIENQVDEEGKEILAMADAMVMVEEFISKKRLPRFFERTLKKEITQDIVTLSNRDLFRLMRGGPLELFTDPEFLTKISKLKTEEKIGKKTSDIINRVNSFVARNSNPETTTEIGAEVFELLSSKRFDEDTLDFLLATNIHEMLDNANLLSSLDKPELTKFIIDGTSLDIQLKNNEKLFRELYGDQRFEVLMNFAEFAKANAQNLSKDVTSMEQFLRGSLGSGLVFGGATGNPVVWASSEAAALGISRLLMSPDSIAFAIMLGKSPLLDLERSPLLKSRLARESVRFGARTAVDQDVEKPIINIPNLNLQRAQ